MRCKDHQPLDGLGAHKLVLAAASPNFLKKVLSGEKKITTCSHTFVRIKLRRVLTKIKKLIFYMIFIILYYGNNKKYISQQNHKFENKTFAISRNLWLDELESCHAIHHYFYPHLRSLDVFDLKLENMNG